MYAKSISDFGHLPRGARFARRVIDIGGRCMAMVATGQRGPTVVLETGLGAESAEWSQVQEGLEGFVRAIRYDRAGRGASDPAPGPRTARDMVEDLRLMLRRAGEAGPFVLVGHSFGGLIARIFADAYRDEVAGLVLVDSLHEDQFAVFAPTFPPARASEPPGLTATRAFWTGGWRDPGATMERIDMPASLDQGRSISSLDDLPVRILTAGTYLNQADVPAPIRPVLQGLWMELQRQFVDLSTRAEQIVFPECGHFVQRDDPGAVIDAVCQVVSQARHS
jgi:pimeloyl-ACP methyl ester carboxylesterase